MLVNEGVGTTKVGEEVGAGNLRADLAIEATRVGMESTKGVALNAVDVTFLRVVPAIDTREGTTDTTRIKRDDVVLALEDSVEVGSKQLVVLGSILASEELEARTTRTTRVGEEGAKNVFLGSVASTAG